MKVKDKVKLILEQMPEMRDSDKKLTLYYWSRQGLELTPEQEKIFIDKCLPSETITRARRLVQEENPNLKGSEEVEKERQRKAVDYRYNAEPHLVEDEYKPHEWKPQAVSWMED